MTTKATIEITYNGDAQGSGMVSARIDGVAHDVEWDYGFDEPVMLLTAHPSPVVARGSAVPAVLTEALRSAIDRRSAFNRAMLEGVERSTPITMVHPDLLVTEPSGAD